MGKLVPWFLSVHLHVGYPRYVYVIFCARSVWLGFRSVAYPSYFPFPISRPRFVSFRSVLLPFVDVVFVLFVVRRRVWFLLFLLFLAVYFYFGLELIVNMKESQNVYKNVYTPSRSPWTIFIGGHINNSISGQSRSENESFYCADRALKCNKKIMEYMENLGGKSIRIVNFRLHLNN